MNNTILQNKNAFSLLNFVILVLLFYGGGD